MDKLSIDYRTAKDLVYNSSAWGYLYSQPNPFIQEFLDIAAGDADEVEINNGKVISVTYKLDKDSEKKSK